MATKELDARDERQLEAAGKVGATAQTTGLLRGYAARRAHTVTQQFKPAKEQAEPAEAATLTAREIDAALDRDEESFSAAVARRVKEIDDEVARERAIPNRQLAELDGEYLGKLQRISIQEQRELQARVDANTDVLLIDAINDPNEIAAIVAEAIDANRPEHVQRVACAAQARLSRLASAEARSTSQPGGIRPAVDASIRVGQQIKEWRAREAERSPAVRKQRLLNQHQIELQQRRQAAKNAAGLFKLALRDRR